MASSPGTPKDTDAKGHARFLADVFPAEKRYIERRRQALDPAASLPRPPTAAPSTADGLVGLALSGGGIRSAAFNLGVLQALHRRGVLHRVDYLSTVSGGGWIGAAFQALLASDPGTAKPAPFPFAPPDEVSSASPALGHLRAHAETLVPLGVGGGARALALLVRGQLLTWSLLLPVVIFLVCASSPLVTVYLGWCFARHGLLVHPPRPGWLPPWHWFTEVSRYLLGLAVAWNALTMLLLSLTRAGPSLRRRLERSGSIALGGALVALATELQVYVIIRWYHAVMYPPAGRGFPWEQALQVAAAGAVVTWLVARFAPHGRQIVRPLMLAAAFGVSVAVPYATYLVAVSAFLRRYPTTDSTGWMSDVLAPSWWPSAALAAFVFAIVLHANHVSLHGFYRGRLSRMFLLRALPPAEAGGRPGVASAEAVRLSEINRDGSWAPYALLNAALNLQGVDDASLHGRQCDFFVFSRYFVGSDRAGYCATRDMEELVPELDLGTALAVSGAAAAPNMGTYTAGATVSLMTFLNIRLGYWLPHPSRVSARPAPTGWLGRLRWYPAGLTCYLRELLSRIDDRGDLVFLTDGGHLENTGAYELLRRRCAVVIASDAEEDPALAFGGLAALVRYARISLGTEIELDVSALRRDAKGFSTAHAVVGTIRYPALDGIAPETGTFVYLKATVTGDEDVLIEEYRSRNDDFPHQSTADQVFDEAQFEAYRSLGHHAAEADALHGWVAAPQP